jgi:hypothetical protein
VDNRFSVAIIIENSKCRDRKDAATPAKPFPSRASRQWKMTNGKWKMENAV